METILDSKQGVTETGGKEVTVDLRGREGEEPNSDPCPLQTLLMTDPMKHLKSGFDLPPRCSR